MWDQLGERLLSRRRAIMLAAVAITALAALLSRGTFEAAKQGGFDDPGSESARAAAILERDLGTGLGDLVLLFDAGGKSVVSIPVATEIRRVLDIARRDPGVFNISSFQDTGDVDMLTTDRTMAWAAISLRGTDDEKRTTYSERLRDQLRSDEIIVLHSGEVPANAEVTRAIESDLRRAELIALPLTLIVLRLLFGGAVAAGLPVLIGAMAISGALAVSRLLASFMDVSVFALNVITMLGLGVAIDYSLFMISRYREEMARTGDDIAASVSRMVATAGRSVGLSAATTTLSLGSLLLFPEMFLRSIAIGSILAVLGGALVAIVVLPAIIAALALAAGRPRAPRPGSPLRIAGWGSGRLVGYLGDRFNAFPRDRQLPSDRGFWHALSRFGARYPLPLATVVVVVLLAAGIPFLRIDLSLPDERVVPAHFESRQTAGVIKTAFDSNTGPTIVALRFEDGAAITHYDDIGAYEQRIAAVPGVEDTRSITLLDRDLALGISDDTEAIGAIDDIRARLVAGGTAVIEVTLVGDPKGPAAQRTLQALRRIPPPPDAEVLIGGAAAEIVDAKASIRQRAPLVAAYVILVTFVVLLIEFRSVVLPLKAIFLNAISLTASFGALVWIFQDGHLRWLLRFDEVGFVMTASPVLIFAIVFGLSMDYEIFMLSRIREEYEATGDSQLAVSRGLQRTGRLITGAALLLVIVIGAFGTGEVVILKQIGVGLALAIVIDATIVRALLVPASMQLLGRWNWWAPRWLGGRPLPRPERAAGVRGD